MIPNFTLKTSNANSKLLSEKGPEPTQYEVPSFPAMSVHMGPERTAAFVNRSRAQAETLNFLEQHSTHFRMLSGSEKMKIINMIQPDIPNEICTPEQAEEYYKGIKIGPIGSIHEDVLDD